MLIDATHHQVALQSSNFCPVQPIVMKIIMTMYFYTEHLIPSATFRRFINSKASRRSCIIMLPKRRAIGRSTPQARKRRALRASESDEQRALRLENL
ncbi:hypothetical protein TNCV_2682061 [Trichonephila clavipes]|nr:hypothetical protein TNCV_2682061 [Trichonephila clavipes]